MRRIQIPPPRRALASADHAAGRTNAGQAGETAIALRRAQRKHQSPQRHPLTQGAAADSTVYHPAADICRVNSPSARTHPKSKTRFARTNDIYSFAAPNGGAAREALTSVLSKIGSPLPLPEQPNQKRRPQRRLFLWNNSLSDVPLPIPHGSLLPSAYVGTVCMVSENLRADIALAHTAFAARDVLGGEGLREDASDDHAGDDVVEAVRCGA